MIPEKTIINKIYIIRGRKVMIDKDLAELYEVETKALKRAVRRNILRFPVDFMFELNDEELLNLRCQFGTSSWGGIRYSPMAFTEQGVAMLSSVLKSDRAIMVNILIIRIFTRIRDLVSAHHEILEKLRNLEKNDLEQNEKILFLLEYMQEIEQERERRRESKDVQKIGYRI